MQFTLFPSGTSTTATRQISIPDFLNEIREEKYKSKLKTVQDEYLKNGKSKIYQELKKNLPAVTFACSCHNRKKDHSIEEKLIEYNGIIQIDIDEALAPELLQQIKDDEYIMFAFKSPSGGFKGAIQLEFTELQINNIDSFHKSGFNQVEAYFKDKYQVNLDKSVKDVFRICFVSADPELVINPNYKKFNVVVVPEVIQQESQQKKQQKTAIIKPIDDNQLNKIISIAQNILLNSAEGGRHAARLKAGELLGGYVESGYFTEEQALYALLDIALSVKNDGEYEAKRILSNAIKHGREKPLEISFLDSKEFLSFIIPEDTKEEKICMTLAEKDLKIIEAPTGYGKSFLIRKQAVYMAKQGHLITILVPTKTMAEDYFKKIIYEYDFNDVSLNLSKQIKDDNEIKGIGKNEIKKIAISTYGYLGRYGDTATTHKIAEKLLIDRFIFCDEIQVIAEKSNIFLPLSAKYLKHETTFSKIEKCPRRKQPNRHKCDDCINSFLRMSKDEHKNQDFYYSFFEEHKADYVKTQNIGSLSLYGDLFEREKNYMYSKIKKKSEDIPAIFFGDSTKITFDDAVDNIIDFSINPHLTQTCPIDKQGNQILSNANNDAIFPTYACYTPILKGIDTLPMRQILASKGVLFCSATIPDMFYEILNNIKHDFKISKQILNHNPIKFRATFLTTCRNLSAYTLANTIKILEDNIKNGILIITAYMSDSKNLTGALNKVSCNFVRYSEDGFEKDVNIYKPAKNEKESIVLLYSRSPYSTGKDFPDKDILIIDCSNFQPQIACLSDTKEMRREEIEDKTNKLIQQCIGRVLRTEKKRIEGEIIQDDRQLVILLYGLKSPLTINKNLFYEHKHISESFFAKESDYKGLAENIINAINGAPIINFKELKEAELIEKIKELGQSAISKKQRIHQKEVIEEIKTAKQEIKEEIKEQAKQEIKEQVLKAKDELKDFKKAERRLKIIEEATINPDNWREISLKYNLYKNFNGGEIAEIENTIENKTGKKLYKKETKKRRGAQ